MKRKGNQESITYDPSKQKANPNANSPKTQKQNEKVTLKDTKHSPLC